MRSMHRLLIAFGGVAALLVASTAGSHSHAVGATGSTEQNAVNPVSSRPELVTTPAGQQFYVLHWNIAGATTNDGDPDKPNNFGSAAPVMNRLADIAESWHPAIISINEACDEQVDYLRAALAERGMEVMAWKFNRTATDSPGDLHPACALEGGAYEGNAILSMVPASDPADIYFNDTTNELVGYRQERGGACLTVHLDKNARVCTFHLATDAAKAVSQMRAFVTRYHDDIEQFPFMVLGDVNVTPDQLRGTMYTPDVGGNGQFYEADMDAPNLGLPTFHGRKLDYAFFNSRFFARDALAAAIVEPGTCMVENVLQLPWFVLYPHPCSDHRALVATATLLTDSSGYPPLPPQPPLDQAPVVSAGPDQTGAEGSPVQLSGSASDAESTPRVSWSYQAGPKVDSGASCSFGDTQALQTTFTCTDDGTYWVALTADDGVNPLVSDVARITLANQPPRLSLIAPQPWQVYKANSPVQLDASFTDAGTNDTHTCTIAWDDGTTDSFADENGSCGRSHTFAHPGMYTINATVTDDDGGADGKTTMIIVYDTDAGFATGAGFVDSPAGALVSDPNATGKLHFHLNAQYHKGDQGPAPSSEKVSARLNGNDFRLDSTSLEWLVVTPDSKIAVKGTGTVDGHDGYGFVAYGYDAEPDSFRLVVWPLSAGPIPASNILYDNRPGKNYDLDLADPQNLAGGSIRAHT